MGKVYSLLRRPIRTFNVANRAERLLAKNEPNRAPKFKADAAQLDKLLRENPSIVDTLAKKDPSLDNRLKDIYVSSMDPDLKQLQHLSSRYNPDKPLPLDKNVVEDYEFGFKEPDTVKPGYITTREVLSLITDHKKHPHVSKKITAKRYGIKEEEVANILEYYGAFDLHVNKKTKNLKMLEYEIERLEQLETPRVK